MSDPAVATPTTPSLRIALLTYSTKPRGGVVHTLALAEALARAGALVTVWTLGRGGDNTFFRPVDAAVTVRVVPFEARDTESVGERILRSIRVLRDAFEPDEYDLVHAQDCISANAVDRCIRTVHHIDQFETPELMACHERAIVTPDALICVSDAVAAEVAAGWGRGATVIPNGVDAARFAAAAADTVDAAAARERWSHELGPYVLAVGGIEPRKGTLDLLEAFALLVADRVADPASTVPAGLSLVIAGGETLFDYRDYRRAFDTRAAELGITVKMLGTINNDELPALVAAAAVLGFVSTKEGFGLAAMEALAAGVPVVARDLPVLREVFRDAVRYATDPAGIAAALRASLRNDEDADESHTTSNTPAIADRGRRLAASYTWDAAAAAHLALYRSLLTVAP